MSSVLVIIRALFSLVGLALIVLGILFWTGHALALIPLHILLGAIFVVCMWLIGAFALRAHAAPVLAIIVLAWSLVVPFVGMAQLHLLPGSLHWIIQTVHLLVGLIAMGLGHALTKRIRTVGTAAAG